MSRALLSLLCGLALIGEAFADLPPPTANDPNEGVQFSKEGSGADTHFDLSWWGRANWTYFFQVSEDLVTWRYFPDIVVLGSQGMPIGPASFNVSGTDRFFVRLRHVPFAITDPFDADTDGDKVSTRDEFLSGTDPLLTDLILPFPDADGDGMSDDWETQYGLDPHDASDGGPNADLDEDGVSNLIEFQTGAFGTDPSDYYRGSYPDIRVVGWTFPADEPGTVTEPLVCEVTRGANPVTKEVNVPVTIFTEGSDTGLLSESAAGTDLKVRLRLRTDSNGQVTVYFKHPSAIPPVPTQRIIHVRVGSTAPAGQFAGGTVFATSQHDYPYPPNTVGLSASEAIDSRIATIASNDVADAKLVFSTQDHGTLIRPPTYIRNTAAWCYDLRQQMTCISPWNNFGFNLGAGTAITAQHVIGSAHNQLLLDTKIRFITADFPHQVVEKTIRGKETHPGYSFPHNDFTVYTLDSLLPGTITPCKVLPNYVDHLSYLENRRPPVMCLDQEEKALVSELRNLGPPMEPSPTIFAYFVKPGLHRNRLEFYEDIIGGDSGNPAFLIINPPGAEPETLVLLSTASAIGAEYPAGFATFVTPQISALNDMIVAADANATARGYPASTGLTVQTINLSGFSTPVPP